MLGWQQQRAASKITFPSCKLHFIRDRGEASILFNGVGGSSSNNRGRLARSPSLVRKAKHMMWIGRSRVSFSGLGSSSRGPS